MMATEVEIRDLNRRIAAADKDLAAKQEALDERVEKLKTDGTALADLAPDDMRELTAARAELDRMKDERVALGDFARTVAAQHAARHTDSDSEKGGSVDATFHQLVFGGTPTTALLAGGVNTPGVEIASRDQLVARMEAGRAWFKADTASALLDAGIPLDERLYPPVETRRRQVRLLDLITVGATDSDTVVYARQTTRTSAAAETALGSGYSAASFAFEQVTASVKSIGHYTTAYRENIADAAQFDTLVRGQLQEDVLLRLESQIWAGDGVSANIAGVLDDSVAIPTVTYDATNERRVMAIHRAITAVRTGAFREPTAVVMSPVDYQEMLFEEIGLSSTEGWAGAFMPDLTGATPGTVWGLQIVVSTVATDGEAVVGYWPDATLWVREGVNLRVSDSHSDFFIKRMVAIVADMRAAFSVQRPAAFCGVLYV